MTLTETRTRALKNHLATVAAQLGVAQGYEPEVVLPLDGKLLAHLLRVRSGLGFGFGFGFGLASCSRTLRRCWPTAAGEILVVYVLGFGLGRYGLSGEPPG